MFKCVVGEEAEYVLKEIDEGCCVDHVGARMLFRKELLVGLLWPTMKSYLVRIFQSCEGFQWRGNFQNSPTSLMRPIENLSPSTNGSWTLCDLSPKPELRRN